MTGWNWKNALEQFKKTERQTNLTLSSEFHGYSGGWSISSVYQHWLSGVVISGLQEVLGLPWTDDFNGVHVMEEGVGFNQVNIHQG